MDLFGGWLKDGILGVYISYLIFLIVFCTTFDSRCDCICSHGFDSGSRKGLA